MRVLSGLLLLLVVLAPSLEGLLVHTNGTTTEFHSLYSTIGAWPNNSTIAELVIVRKGDMDGCSFRNKTLGSALVAGKMVVYADYLFEPYLFEECNSDEFGNGAFFAKFMSRSGAAGLIIRMFEYEENYADGRITGFTKSVKMPFVVTTKSVIEYLVTNAVNITSIEIPPISKSDKSFLKYLNRTFEAMVIINDIVYAVVLVLFGFMIFKDVMIFYELRKRPPGIGVKLVVFCSALCAFLWLLVDPNSFQQKKHFPSCFFWYFHIGTTFIVFYMILSIWANVTKKIKPVPYLFVVPYIIYALSGVMFLITFLLSALYYVVDVSSWVIPYRIYCIASLILCEVGYIYYGKNIVFVLINSGNHSIHQRRLSIRIVLFISIFLLLANVAVFVFQTGTLGGLFGVLFFEFFIGICFLTVCIVLFFRGKRKGRPSQDKPSSDRPSQDGASL